MRSCFLFFSLFCVFVISCKKRGNDGPQTPARTWFTVKSIVNTVWENDIPRGRDSADIQIDSVNNRITIKKFEGVGYMLGERSIEKFTYNSKNQLVLYENVDYLNTLYISRMEFVRDAGGKLVKVLSEYKNGIVSNSEGIVKYNQRGDTTFITFIDSTQKQSFLPIPYAQDYYTAGLVNGRLVYRKYYSISLYTGKIDSSETKYEYDTAGNLIVESNLTTNNPDLTFTSQYGSEKPAELQKFLDQWSGDLLWFYRFGNFYFANKLRTVKTVTGNVLLSRSNAGRVVESYTNAFDGKGNLETVSWKSAGTTVPGYPVGTELTSVQKYYYW